VSSFEPFADIPAAVPGLIDAAVAAFDADRDTSRRYLLRALALLRARRKAGVDNAIAWEPSLRGGLATWQLNRVVDFIEAHMAEKIRASDLARLINVSVGQLFRAFKVSVGVTLFHYIARRRLEVARTMLRTTNEPLSQIAVACGLSDQSHFCRVFHRIMGVSPAAWRRANAGLQ
jgi:AraC family transcriptional regulator